MVKTQVSLDETIQFLNEIIAADPQALAELATYRVPCNLELANHPTVQVGQGILNPFTVGLIGILNGLFGVDENGWGPIVFVFDGNILVEARHTAPEDKR